MGSEYRFFVIRSPHEFYPFFLSTPSSAALSQRYRSPSYLFALPTYLSSSLMAKKRHSQPTSRQPKRKRFSDIPPEADTLPKSEVNGSGALPVIPHTPQEPKSMPVRNIIELDNPSSVLVITFTRILANVGRSFLRCLTPTLRQNVLKPCHCPR